MRDAKRRYTRSTYYAMVSRCTNEKNVSFHRYGGRGISVCARWLESLDNFIEDMGLRPDGMTIDRIDSDGNYEPSNCRWATMKAQSRNKSTNHVLDVRGEAMVVTDAAKALGLSVSGLRWRLIRGDDIYQASQNKKGQGTTMVCVTCVVCGKEHQRKLKVVNHAKKNGHKTTCGGLCRSKIRWIKDEPAAARSA